MRPVCARKPIEAGVDVKQPARKEYKRRIWAASTLPVSTGTLLASRRWESEQRLWVCKFPVKRYYPNVFSANENITRPKRAPCVGQARHLAFDFPS
jgi:hypothetical protein